MCNDDCIPGFLYAMHFVIKFYRFSVFEHVIKWHEQIWLPKEKKKSESLIFPPHFCAFLCTSFSLAHKIIAKLLLANQIYKYQIIKWILDESRWLASYFVESWYMTSISDMICTMSFHAGLIKSVAISVNSMNVQWANSPVGDNSI